MSEHPAAVLTGYPSLRGYLTGVWTGTWTVERMIEDLATGRVGSFAGIAAFTASDGGTLTYREEGTLRWASESGRPAEREYLWRPGPGDWEMNVHFADGRFFHALDLHSGAAGTEHACSPDLYRGTFRLNGPDSWSYRWRVNGPAKDLELSTVLTRSQQPTANPAEHFPAADGHV